MDDGVGGVFVARIEPVDTPDGALHCPFDGVVHLFDCLVHGAIINTESGAYMNSLQQGCDFLTVARRKKQDSCGCLTHGKPARPEEIQLSRPG